jgi:hypothetical protein
LKREGGEGRSGKGRKGDETTGDVRRSGEGKRE